MIVWTPPHPDKTQMANFMRFVGKEKMSYLDFHKWSIRKPALFWEKLCQFYKISFDKPPETILENPNDLLKAVWFRGAYFNFAEKMLSRRDGYPALISVTETGVRLSLTYAELYERVARLSASLKNQGVGVGTRVAGILPNIPETIIAMLATTSLGGIWSSCSPDFGSAALLDRLSQIEPSVVFICDGYRYQGKTFITLEKSTELLKNLPSLSKLVVVPFLEEGNGPFKDSRLIDWTSFLEKDTVLNFTSLPFNHPIYILFSSGTTGKPKCIVHSAGGTLLQHVKELGLHTDLTQHDNFCYITTCGWMMWNWMVSALTLGTTLTLWEGSPSFPNISVLFDLIDNQKITVLGTSAKFLSSVQKFGYEPIKHHRLDHLKTILSTGSPLLPHNYDFVYQHVKPSVQLSSISGGTDIVSCFALGNPLTPVYKGELQCIGLGMAVDVFDREGHSTNEKGELVCVKPFPAMPIGFWNDPDKSRFKHAYFSKFPKVWAHGDYACKTEHGGLIIYGRSDTVLNPGGVRIGTAEIYRQVEKIPEILDSVVIGQDWDNDVRIVLFVKLQDQCELEESLIARIKNTIRQYASPRHVPHKILSVKDIPRTLSGKVVELAVKQVVSGEKVQNVECLANPESLQYFKDRSELSV